MLQRTQFNSVNYSKRSKKYSMMKQGIIFVLFLYILTYSASEKQQNDLGSRNKRDAYRESPKPNLFARLQTDIEASSGSKRKIIRLMIGSGWIQVNFPVDFESDIIKTYRLNYRKKGDTIWSKTRFSEKIYHSGQHSRVIPPGSCPEWKEKPVFCILASDNIRPSRAPWTYYEAEIETKILSPPAHMKLEEVEKFKFEFQVSNCDPTRSSCKQTSRQKPELVTISGQSENDPREQVGAFSVCRRATTWETWATSVGSALVFLLTMGYSAHLYIKRKISKTLLRRWLDELAAFPRKWKGPLKRGSGVVPACYRSSSCPRKREDRRVVSRRKSHLGRRARSVPVRLLLSE